MVTTIKNLYFFEAILLAFHILIMWFVLGSLETRFSNRKLRFSERLTN